jgi:hypothetical protein
MLCDLSLKFRVSHPTCGFSKFHLQLLKLCGQTIVFVFLFLDLLIKSDQFLWRSCLEEILIDQIDLGFAVFLASQNVRASQFIHDALACHFLDPLLKVIEDVLNGVRTVLTLHKLSNAFLSFLVIHGLLRRIVIDLLLLLSHLFNLTSVLLFFVLLLFFLFFFRLLPILLSRGLILLDGSLRILRLSGLLFFFFFSLLLLLFSLFLFCVLLACTCLRILDTLIVVLLPKLLVFWLDCLLLLLVLLSVILHGHVFFLLLLLLHRSWCLLNCEDVQRGLSLSATWGSC